MLHVKFVAILVNSNKGFLRDISGVFLVLEATDQISEEFRAVALYEIVKSGVVTSKEAEHVGPIALGRVVLIVRLGAHDLTFTRKLTEPLPRGPS